MSRALIGLVGGLMFNKNSKTEQPDYYTTFLREKKVKLLELGEGEKYEIVVRPWRIYIVAAVMSACVITSTVLLLAQSKQPFRRFRNYKLQLVMTFSILLIALALILTASTEKIIFHSERGIVVLKKESCCKTERHKVKVNQIKDVGLLLLGEIRGMQNSLHYVIEIELISKKRVRMFKTGDRLRAKTRLLEIKMLLGLDQDARNIVIEGRLNENSEEENEKPLNTKNNTEKQARTVKRRVYFEEDLENERRNLLQ